MYILTQNFPSSPLFQGKRINITREQILELRAKGVKETDMPKMLGISLATYYEKLKKLAIPKAQEVYQNNLSEIVSREKLELMIKEKVSVSEICKQLNITESTYYTLLKKYNLRSYLVGISRKLVTKEQLQMLVNQKKSISEICNELNITKNAYYELVQKLNIVTEYKANKLNIVKITKEQLENLLRENKSYEEISNELGISFSTIQNLIAKFHIQTKILNSKKHIKKITKEQLINYINSDKTMSEICQELQISIRTCSLLIKKFGIVTDIQKSKDNIKKITRDELQKLIDDGVSRENICKKLHISTETMFYKLLKRLNINYNYQNHNAEIDVPVSKLQHVIDNWTFAGDIENKISISNTTFYEKAKLAKLKTVLQDNIDKIKGLDINEVQKLLDSGVHWREICERFNISPNTYRSILREHNLITQERKLRINSQHITKEQLEELINSGKTIKEICKELNISKTTLYKKIEQFDLKK